MGDEPYEGLADMFPPPSSIGHLFCFGRKKDHSYLTEQTETHQTRKSNTEQGWWEQESVLLNDSINPDTVKITTSFTPPREFVFRRLSCRPALRT